MRNEDDNKSYSAETLKASLLMIGFALFVLTYLVAIDRPHWFNLRPVSGTAQALSLASTGHEQDRAAFRAR